MSESWAGQRAALASSELVPGVCEMTLAIVLHYLATGERLLPSVYTRMSDVDSSGRRVWVSGALALTVCACAAGATIPTTTSAWRA
jgi:hypothetical protein